MIDEFPSLPSVGLDKWDYEKLRLGLFKNYFLIPPFLKNITEEYGMSVKNMVKLWFWRKDLFVGRPGWHYDYYYYCYYAKMYCMLAIARHNMYSLIYSSQSCCHPHLTVEETETPAVMPKGMSYEAEMPGATPGFRNSVRC